MIIVLIVILFTCVFIQKSEKPEWHVNNQDAYISKFLIFFLPLHLQVVVYPSSPPPPLSHAPTECAIHHIFFPPSS